MPFLILKREKTLVKSTHIFGSVTNDQAEADKAMHQCLFVVELTETDLEKLIEMRDALKTV